MEENYIDIGRIEVIKFKEISNNIITDEVILTSERYNHIMERHKQDFELYFNEFGTVISDPDYILKDFKNKDTAIVIKHIDNTNLNIVLKLAIGKDSIHTKNSIMTCYRIRNKNLQKLKEKNKIVYKSE